MNIKLLKRVKAQILKEPKQFDMHRWFKCTLDWKIPNCGTAACIGGWAIALETKKTPRAAYEAGLHHWSHMWFNNKAASVLALNECEAYRLFNTPVWPDRLRQAYINAKRPSTKAKIAARRIDHFIKTKGME